MQKSDLAEYKKIQKIAKETMEYLDAYIMEGITESDIADTAKEFMIKKGVSSFWYYGLAALVLVGSRTTESISGKNYVATETKVKDNDLVTVDLSPELNQYWGDLARSFVLENGKVIKKPNKNSTGKTLELFDGVGAEKRLHNKLAEIASPNITFGELYLAMNKEIDKLGYVNIDFKKNLGHSIEKHKENRIYIENGCNIKLSEANLFTFEPHIKKTQGSFGYKWEDIYYFSEGSLKRV